MLSILFVLLSSIAHAEFRDVSDVSSGDVAPLVKETLYRLEAPTAAGYNLLIKSQEPSEPDPTTWGQRSFYDRFCLAEETNNLIVRRGPCLRTARTLGWVNADRDVARNAVQKADGAYFIRKLFPPPGSVQHPESPAFATDIAKAPNLLIATSKAKPEYSFALGQFDDQILKSNLILVPMLIPPVASLEIYKVAGTDRLRIQADAVGDTLVIYPAIVRTKQVAFAGQGDGIGYHTQERINPTTYDVTYRRVVLGRSTSDGILPVRHYYTEVGPDGSLAFVHEHATSGASLRLRLPEVGNELEFSSKTLKPVKVKFTRVRSRKVTPDTSIFQYARALGEVGGLPSQQPYPITFKVEAEEACAAALTEAAVAVK